MATLYVRIQLSVIRISSNQILVTTIAQNNEYKVIDAFKAALIDNILLFGKIHVTSDALKYFMNNNINVSFFSQNGRLYGHVFGTGAKNGALHLAQYHTYFNLPRRLEYARNIVSGKIGNQIKMLRYYKSNATTEAAQIISTSVSKLGSLLTLLESATSIQELLGYEGRSSCIYFDAYATLFTGELKFSGRQKRPAPDPVNAMLSLGYTLLLNLLNNLLLSRGLETTIAFLHEVNRNRDSLACDLVEEFRGPIVERFVLRTCNLNQLTAKDFDFDEKKGAVVFKEDKIKEFFKLWEEYLSRTVNTIGSSKDNRPTAIELFSKQVDSLAQALEKGILYEPFEFEL